MVKAVAKIECICKQCGKTFEAQPCMVKRGAGKYCGRECFLNSKPKKIECTCLHCKKVFYITPSMAKAGYGKCCSIECRNSLRVERTCLHCGKIFSVPRCRIKQGGCNYCSDECYQAKRTALIDCTCPTCGKLFSVKQFEIAKGRRYCSRKCREIDQITLLEATCVQCGKSFIRSRNQVIKGRAKFCSRECHDLSQRGSGSIKWRGGSIRYYGPNWYAQRKAAYSRDGGICQICHHKPKKGERICHVHHIKKIRYFNGDYEAANDLSNLITLCWRCHPKAERGQLPVPVRLF